MLDAAGGHSVKLLPATQALLYASVDEALAADEPDWQTPREHLSVANDAVGAWGTQRAVLFSGMR